MVLVLAAIVGAGCEAPPAAPGAPSSADLEGEVVAQVGSQSVTAATVRRVASAQGITPEEARRRAIRDALFAEEARGRGADVRGLEASVLARSLFDVLRRESAGPVTDDELEAVTRRHWLQLRRPEGVRVVHALVHRPRTGPSRPPTEEEMSAMREVARALRAAVEPASAPARRGPEAREEAVTSFRALAAAVDRREFEVTVESLDPFTSEGKLMGRSGGALVPEFVEATWPLRDAGALTEPFASSFGVHVAMLLERVPPHEVPAEQRRAFVADEVLDDRIRLRRREVLEPARSTVELAPNAGALLDLVAVR